MVFGDGEQAKVSKEDADLASWQKTNRTERTKICREDMGKAIKETTEKCGFDVSHNHIEKTLNKITKKSEDLNK